VSPSSLPAITDAIDRVCLTHYVNCNISGRDPSPGSLYSIDCSEEEVLSGKEKRRYYSMDADGCTWQAGQIAASRDSALERVTCCNTPLCNKPDPARDTSVSVVATLEGALASLACYVNVEEPQQLLAGTTPPAAAFLMELPAAVNSLITWNSYTMASRFDYQRSEPSVCAKFLYSPCGWAWHLWNRYFENPAINMACYTQPDGTPPSPQLFTPRWAYVRRDFKHVAQW
jgi:hypothetical protein